MPLGPFGEIVGTTGTKEMLGEHAEQLMGKSKVAVPRNPKLVTDAHVDYELTPSRYMFQMSLTTEQKLANTHAMRLPMKIELLDMQDTTHQKYSRINIEEPMFQPFPSEIFFQNYKPHEVYEIPLLLRNGDKVPRLVKVSQADSPYFSIVSPHDVGHKVGPGLPTIFKIQFRPDDNRDYSHELVCVTEREKFIVPVKAIGARAILDFPDQVNFPPSPVKYNATKTLLVRNVGNRDAKFSLHAEKPFSVEPENGILPANESMQVTIEFKPLVVGDFNRDLLLDLDTGETIHIKLYGASEDALVRLDKNSVRVQNTYISMANQRTVAIVNRSDVIVKFSWSNYATPDEEQQQKHGFYSELRREEAGETDRFLEECNADPSIRDKLAILSRTFSNRRMAVETDTMLFQDAVFSISPVEGEVWPNSSVECEVIFKPDRHDNYQLTAFCDVTGRESRLPLKIRGEGIGPQVQFSFDRLDMGHIFINATHTYEVVLANRGDIDAIFSVLPNKSSFGQRFHFNPSEGIVMPDGHQAIEIKFSSPLLGEFDEVFQFQIDGSLHRMEINFRGVVIGPTFHFDVPKLKFGTISYGFPFTQECTLYNTSLVPMAYTLRIPSDGETKSVLAMEPGARDNCIARPREFEIRPNRGRLAPQSSEKITVEVVSNSLKKYDGSLVVDVEGVGEEVLTLPIQARCVCPYVSILTPVIEYGRCFLRHPYERSIKLSNDSDLPAKYELLPQTDDTLSSISYSSPKSQGLIEPRAVIDVPLVITPLGLDELSATVHLHIFGSPEPSVTIHVTCVGEGPVVHIEPLELDWGSIPVLTDLPRVIKMSNESLIPAKFSASMVRTGSSWRVEPSEGEIPPEHETEITIIANLNDCLRFQDKLRINIENSFCRVIPVCGQGQGTTIHADVSFGPQCQLGPHFGCSPLKKVIKFTNRGRRHQQLVWTTDGFPMIKKNRDPSLADKNDMRIKNLPPPAHVPRPIFALTPARMELQPGETVIAVLEGSVNEPQVVRERLLCHAIIGRSGGKELIKKVDLCAEFIAPVLEFSDRHLFFRVDKLPGDELCLQYRDLQVKNASNLPVTANLKVQYPFQLITMTDGEDVQLVQDMSLNLTSDENAMIKIQFDPFYVDDYHIRTVDQTLTVSYAQHPHVDEISLRGEVYFPNLQFEKATVDFGCVLNDTEVTRYVNITNNSPMDVSYKWSFLVGDQPHAIWNRRQPNNVLKPGPPSTVKSAASTVSAASLDAHLLDLEVAEEAEDAAEDELHPDVEPADEMTEKGERETRGTDLDKSPVSTPRGKVMNPVLQSLLLEDCEPRPVGVEEVFDILPLYGHLKPGDTEQITFTFYGHADIWSKARAICEVDGGPTYELQLKGEAGLVEYKFDCMEIDYGNRMYNEVAEAEITLINTGKVGFDYTAMDVDPRMVVKPKPGIPIVTPHKGYLEPLGEQKLNVKYFPGVPNYFQKDLLIQVAHFEPDTIRVRGNGIFPRVSLDLPRSAVEEYSTLVENVKQMWNADGRTVDESKSDEKTADPTVVPVPLSAKVSEGPSFSELEIHMEAERLMVERFAEEQFQIQEETVDILDVNGDQQIHETKNHKVSKKHKARPRLTEYVLDFGHVILGTVRTHVVRATNSGQIPVSFGVERNNIHQYGFHVELDRVRHLPGAPDHETVDFVVSFDPRGANLSLGLVETTVPINIVNGPSIGLCLRAEVTMPDLEISTDNLDFGDVKCGECKVVTVQLHNHQHVRCQWTSVSNDNDKVKVDRTIPMHLRRKIKPDKPRPKTFEVMPPSGCLLPGQRINVQVKFMPSEEKYYEQRLSLRLMQSSRRILLFARGQGLEPKLEFSRVMVEFGPILPHSVGDEQDIVVKNPCSFPLEFYNLEFDRVYLEEEKILRLMKGYDEYNTILLPPRPPGDKLPQELLDYYDEQMKKLEEVERLQKNPEEKPAEQTGEPAPEQLTPESKRETIPEKPAQPEAAPEAKQDVPLLVTTAPTRGSSIMDRDQSVPAPGSTVPVEDALQPDASAQKADEARESASSIGVGELEITPVSAAIARHLGIDLSPDGRAARNRRGVAIIVHGAPMSDQCGVAVRLAQHYGAALLNVDAVIIDAISSGSSPAGLRARQLCQEASRRADEQAQAAEEGVEGGPKSAGLSVEQLNAHTQDLASLAAVQSTVHGFAGTRKTSVIQGKEKHHGSSIATGKTGEEKKSSEGVTGSQPCSSPPPQALPLARRLSVSASVAGEDGLISTILPEDVVVAILAERLQLSDCHRGIVFDGLETLFCPSISSAALAILKAFNNRKYMFFVTLKNDFNVMKENERKRELEKEREALEAEEREKQRLEDMSEDEYDNLSDEIKAQVDLKRLEAKKERIRRENEERMERERREREAALEAEARRLEEEKANKRRGKKGGAAPHGTADDKKGDKKGPGVKSGSQDKIAAKSKHDDHKDGKVTDRPESLATEKSDSDADGKKKKPGKEPSNAAKRPVSNEASKTDGQIATEEVVKDPAKDADLLLQQKFRVFDHSLKEINEYLTSWDRTTGQLRRPQSPSERSEVVEDHPPSGKKGKKEKHDKDRARERAAREAETAASSIGLEDGADMAEQDTECGITNIVVNCHEPDVDPPFNVLQSEVLPSPEDVLDGLGMGLLGPPLPPPALFSVVPYPVKRRAPPGADPEGNYVFIASSPDDPNLGSVDGESRADEDDKSATPERPDKDQSPHSKSRKEKLRVESRTERSESRKKSGKSKDRQSRRPSLNVISPPPGTDTPMSESDGLGRLGQFRWVIPANSEVVLRLRFSSEDLGQFDQTMNFEIMGTRRRYQLFCRGVSSFPTISKEPRLVFSQRKKSKDAETIVKKTFILTNDTYEFGPLLVGKSREKYKEDKYPENSEKLTIINSSPLEADVNFCFLNDSKAETFLLDPPQMLLKPGQSSTLKIWAYPKTAGRFEDSVICCIRENPEPVTFNVVCDGVRPELEIDKKQLHFDKVLLHRKDTKVIYLRNSTLLPVAWRISGLDALGDDFSVSQESGVIEPKSEFGLQAYFRAMKPITTSKKSIRLEVYDLDNIIGLVHTENIQIFAEAYDVALDMSFPKGAEGGIDFGIIRVMDEAKQTCTLKNKGKYEIGFNFVLESQNASCADISNLFSVIPQKGTLTANDRPTQVQIVFKSHQERTIRDLPFLKCQVIEPNIADTGETIASIPIKVSVKSVFSKYNIFPIDDINFGAMLLNSRKTRTFTIENKGEFDFKYTIQKSLKATETQQTVKSTGRPQQRGPDKYTKSREGSSSGRSVTNKNKRVESTRQDIGAGGGAVGARLGVGAFAVYPSFGSILPGAQQLITVECLAETPGRCEEELAIDISDRDSTDHKDGIPYKLMNECCVPQINTMDIGAIFEEHRICKSMSSVQGQKMDIASVYFEDESKFVFNNVVVGSRATARIKLTNTSKVPCDVSCGIRAPVSKHSSKAPQDIFDVEPARAQIPAHGHMFATIGFSPSSMQLFTSVFEAILEGASGSNKSKPLTFDVSGEGNLPRISVLKPAIKNRKGQPLCLFKRNLIGRSESLQLVLQNDGNLPSKVNIDLIDPDEVFSLKAGKSTTAFMAADDFESKRLPHTASVVINVDEMAQFDVIYKPTKIQRSQAHIKISIVHNEYEDNIIHLVGEGYVDEVSLDNIHSVIQDIDPEKHEGTMADDDIEAANNCLVHFGDCTVKQAKTLSFSMTNHSETDILRFVWPELPDLSFSPMKGHLHPKTTKDMTVTLKCSAPRTLEKFEVDCKLVKITIEDSADKVPDWDDRLRTVRWLDNQKTEPNADGSLKTPVTGGTRKKVVETEAEPAFMEIADSARTIQLQVSAVIDYAKFECGVDTVKFKDTLMFQSRFYEFTLSNAGTVEMDFSWTVAMEDGTTAAGPRSVTFAVGSRPPSQDGSIVSTTMAEDGYQPFSVSPASGSIPAGKTETFIVKFSPLDTADYEGRLLCRIPNLEEGKQGPTVSIRGRSLLPYCHFELEDCDYISGNRRNPELRGPHGSPPGATLDPSTRVMEFETVGVGVKATRYFSIINPTNQDYTFHWVNEDDPDPKHPSCFKCLTMQGNVRTGKRHEIGFQFLPEQLTIEESFWRFIIPERNISIPFLLVGQAREPNVTMDRSHLNFRALLLGHEAMETVHIINEETVPFNFTVDEMSTFTDGHRSRIVVEPLRGTIEPRSSYPLNIFYTPRSTREDNFNLICQVSHKVKPLNLNVKAEGYSMSCMLMCEDGQGNLVEFSHAGYSEIRFGNLDINELALRNLVIFNNGKFRFDYEWQLLQLDNSSSLSISPMKGSTASGEKAECVLSFCPRHKTTLRNCELILKISNGPTYAMNITGSGVMPGLHFSFRTYDFGPKFIYRAGMVAASTILKLTNKDRRDVSVECMYAPTAHLSHDFEACVIAPGGSREVLFTFYPREAVDYKEEVTFDINGLCKQAVTISGSGAVMKIDVANPRHKVVNFGALRVGQSVKKIVPIVNNSPAPLTFQLALTPSEPWLQNPGVLSILPAGEISLAARGGTRKVEVCFSPKYRVPQFTEEVLMECGGIYQPVFAVKGCCHGIEIGLDMEAIPFGAVVQGSSSVRHIMMINSGDIGARFHWDAVKFLPDFSITPVEGYISPGMEVSFDVTFRPQAVSQDVRYENLKCFIEGSAPLKLTLTGMCSSSVPLKEQQHFVTHVRQKETKNINIVNKTNQVWDLRPVIDGEHWTGPSTFHVEPQQSKHYELTYKPVVMTQEGKKHSGSIFFPLPDGTGMLYTLQGTADGPKANGKINRDIPCKTQYVEMLTVENWLKRPQRFKVKMDMIKPEKLDAGTTIKGLDYIDIPGNSKRDYRLAFYAHKEGVSQFKVTFINEYTNEYEFYELSYKAVRPGSMGTISLSTPARLSTQHTITLDNPLLQPISLTATCNIPEVAMPSQLQIPAQSSNMFSFEFLPLRVGPYTGKLEFTCQELGLYLYDLHLQATPACPEKAIHFTTCLGNSQVHVARFLNFARTKTDYSCKVDSPDFHVDKQVAAAPCSSGGTEVCVDVTYEPSKLGQSRGTLTISSLQGGEYVIPLFGSCEHPRPQGPYIIKAGTSSTITFRNVFPHVTAYSFQVDHPAFHIAKTSDNVRARKDHRIVVGFETDQAQKGPVMGKLTVTCAKSAGGATSVQWVYYLKGVL